MAIELHASGWTPSCSSFSGAGEGRPHRLLNGVGLPTVLKRMPFRMC